MHRRPEIGVTSASVESVSAPARAMMKMPEGARKFRASIRRGERADSDVVARRGK